MFFSHGSSFGTLLASKGSHILVRGDTASLAFMESGYNLFELTMEPLSQSKPIDPLNGISNTGQITKTDYQAAASADAAEKSNSKHKSDSPKKFETPLVHTERRGTFFQLGIIIATAALLATLFTAWTPGRPNTLFSGSSDQPNLVISPQPSPTFQPGAPTATLKNPRLIGIVAGHWKNDSGAVCTDGLKEVDINLDIATRVQKILSDDGYQVDLLNEFDKRLEGYQAAALISIHNDSCEFINNEATGFKVAAAFATHHPERSARLTACLRAALFCCYEVIGAQHLRHTRYVQLSRIR